jgi:hypothetical protein
VTPNTDFDKGHLTWVWLRSRKLGSNQGVSSDYRFAQPLVVRFMGVFLVVIGLLVFALAAAVGLLGLPVGVLSAGVVAALAAVLLAGLLVSRRTVVVRLDDTGYLVRYVRGVGAKQARWTDVEDVVATVVAGERCVVLRLRDGRTTTVPAGVLDADPDAFARDLQQHLNRGHGYRPAG